MALPMTAAGDPIRFFYNFIIDNRAGEASPTLKKRMPHWWEAHQSSHVRGDKLRNALALVIPMFFLQDLCDGEQDVFQVVDYIIIPKADDLIALRSKIICSFFVVLFLFQVLTAIQLNDEFGFG